MHQIDRRTARTRTAAGLLALIAMGSLAACSSDGSADASAASCAPAEGPVELSYWMNGISGMEDVVAQWNEQNPDIQVTVSTFDDYPALTNALAGGQAPDMAQIEYSRVTNFRAQDAFIDVSECLDAIDPDAGDGFLDWTWAQATSNGDGVYSIPQDIGPMAMYYNTAAFEKYGVAVPTTWDEFRTAAEAFRANGTYITYFDPTSAGVFNGFMWQNKSRMYDFADDAWQVTVDNDEARQVADFWQGLIDDDLVRTDLVNFSAPVDQAYADGDLAVQLSAAWGYTGLKSAAPDQAGQWAVAPLPVWDAADPVSANWGGSTVAFMQGNEHPYESLKFLLWLNSDPEAVEQTYATGGLFPASKAGQDLEALAQPDDFYGGQKIFEVFSQEAAAVDTDFVWGPTQDAVDRALTDAMAEAVAGDGTIGDALEAAQKEAVDTMTTQGLPVAD